MYFTYFSLNDMYFTYYPNLQQHGDHQMQTLHITQASDIAGNPQWFHSRNLRTLAWAALKAARGQTIRQHRLQAMQQATDRQVTL
jgi:hypothetical protein